jgi:NAD(P)-dependent dehydrogenase (short-subunit alcohol dehydrogenase family)
MTINPIDLSGRSILVTGASSGIGRETGVLLSQLGARVILAGRNKDRLDRTQAILDGSGHHVEQFDLADLDAIPAWVKDLASRYDALHGVVHSAGIYGVYPLRTLTAPQIEETLRLNLNAAILLAKGFRQKGCHAERGAIVFLSSVAGLRGHAGLSAYTASKSALIGVTKSLAIELARDGIRVNNVAPGLVETEMASQFEEQTLAGRTAIETEYPLGIGKPRDVANGIAFLLSDAARWITGATLVIDGGFTAH